MGEDQDRTVFVVGAGASREFGLPVGSELQEQISKITKLSVEAQGGGLNFRGDKRFLEGLSQCAVPASWTQSDKKRLVEKAGIISSGVQSAASIDNFLHHHKDDPEMVNVGKYAIAYCILKAEAESSLGSDGKDGILAMRSANRATCEPHDSWIGRLVKSISSQRSFSEFCMALSSIDFICFNYDRCIERYLRVSLQKIYPVSDFEESLLFSALNIIHPYGYLGPIPSSSDTFGRVSGADFTVLSSRKIQTFTEGMNSETRLQIKKVFQKAKSCFFLGYGYNSINDAFLFDGKPFFLRNVYGTSYGIKDERKAFISDNIRSACLNVKARGGGLIPRIDPTLKSETCADLMDRFSHVLENIGGRTKLT